MELNSHYIKKMFKDLYSITNFKGASIIPIEEIPGELWYVGVGDFIGYLLLCKEEDLPNLFSKIPEKEYDDRSGFLNNKNIYLLGCEESKFLFEYYFPLLSEYIARKNLNSGRFNEFEIQFEIRNRTNLAMTYGRPYVRGEKSISEFKQAQKVVKSKDSL